MKAYFQQAIRRTKEFCAIFLLHLTVLLVLGIQLHKTIAKKKPHSTEEFANLPNQLAMNERDIFDIKKGMEYIRGYVFRDQYKCPLDESEC